MAKSITMSEAVVRFGPLVTTGLEIEEAIQEAVDRVYEMGRYPGTTEEVLLEESDFVEDVDAGEWHISFTEAEYDGAIGFRSRARGWSIVDQSALYKDGINAGDDEFVDLGTITIDGVETRKYRCPRGWQPDQGPFYALMKKEAPTLADDDLIPIARGPLKAAIQAVCYEAVADEQRSQTKWAEFDMLSKLSGRQTAGPKKYFIGMDSSLRRKPSQFY
jgi:hypothetical protein